jgi:hypothetical protein
MARPHVEFIQAQALDWQPTPIAHLAGTHCKMLSHDVTSGACSLLLRLPRGFQLDGPWQLDAEEEFLVLDGGLSVGDLDYGPDCYALLPAHRPRGALQVRQESVLLCFFDRAPQLETGAAAAAHAARPDGSHDAVPRLDAFEMAWESAGMDPAYADIGLRWKMLRGRIGDAQTTMLVACPPHLHPPEWQGPQEIHDCVEEMFLISGDYLSNVGRMREGAYFWRPPGIAHGPYGTRHGNLALIRTLGAPLENNWTREPVAISRAPAARPFLPAALRARHGVPVVPDPY